MCDCPQEHDDEVDRKVGSEAVTNFSKCSTPCRLRKDMLEPSAPDDVCLVPIHVLSFDGNDTSSDSRTRSTATAESSSEPSRTYKSACPTECDYLGEADEDSPKLSATCFCKTDGNKNAIEKKREIEYTLAIVKPEAVIYRKEIGHIVHTEGFEICQTRWLQLTREQVSEFYNDRFDETCFSSLVAYMSSGPIVVFVLAKQNAVEEWRLIIGPTMVTDANLYYPDSIRARYGQRGEIFKNVVHGSDSCEQAEKEIHFFFPDFVIEPLLKVEKTEDFLWETINPVLVKGLILCCKTKPADPVLWLANWLILNNPNKPKLPEDLALIST